MKKLKIVFISDTHTSHNDLKIPECDILIHCGDMSFLGKPNEMRDFAKWLDKQTQAKHIIVSVGNHEVAFENQLPLSRTWITEHCPRVNLLIHEAKEIEGIKFFVSPYTPRFNNWAFNVDRGEPISKYWNEIPEDTEILITHGPPKGVLDDVVHISGIREGIEHVGCQDLLDRVQKLSKLKIHAFGHIHAWGSLTEVNKGIMFINASNCDERYNVTNKPVVIEYEASNGT